MTHNRGGLIPKYAQFYNNFGRVWCIWWSIRSVFGLVPLMGKLCRCCLAIPLEAAPGAADKPHCPPISPGVPLTASSLCGGLWVWSLLVGLSVLMDAGENQTWRWAPAPLVQPAGRGAFFCTNEVSPPVHLLPQRDGCGSASSLPDQ